MKRIKRYQILLGQTLQELEEEVEKAIWRGYEPQGGVFRHTFDQAHDGRMVEALGQAMYMSEDEYDYRMESVERITDVIRDDTGESGD